MIDEWRVRPMLTQIIEFSRPLQSRTIVLPSEAC